ncbi:rhs element Vgr family protein, partial [Escherichia coli EC1862]
TAITRQTRTVHAGSVWHRRGQAPGLVTWRYRVWVRRSLWTSSTAIRTSRSLWGVPTTRKTAHPVACRGRRRR